MKSESTGGNLKSEGLHLAGSWLERSCGLARALCGERRSLPPAGLVAFFDESNYNRVFRFI